MIAPATTLPNDGPLQSSGDPEVDKARDELIDAINFRKGHPFTDPDFFYPSNHQRRRFERNGFTTHVLYYREPKVWWNEFIALIPDNLDNTKEVPTCINFHGGAFFTGDARFQSWWQEHKLRLAYQNKAIILAPNYPLLPFFDGSDIIEALTAFQTHVLSKQFQQDLRAISSGIRIRRTRLFVTGESAGGWLAAKTLLNCLSNIDGSFLDISVVYLNYPMLCHYQHPCPDEGMDYLGTWMSKDEVHTAGRNLLGKTKKYRQALTKASLSPHEVPVPRLWAPIGMGAGMVACCTDDVWTQIFQNGKDVPDIIEQLRCDVASLAERESGRATAGAKQLPELFICHPVGDLNVSVDVSKEFLEHMRKLLRDDSTLHLCGLEKLDHPERAGEKDDYVPRHGFDNEILPENEEWLEKIVRGIERAWHAPLRAIDSSSIS